MKLFIASILACVITGIGSSYAQLPKGTTAIGLNLSAGLSNDDVTSQRNQKSWNLAVRPKFDFFIKENLSVGIAPSYAISKNIYATTPSGNNSYPTKNTSKNEQYGLNFSITKYWFTGNQKLGVYLSPTYAPIYSESTSTNFIDIPGNTTDQNTSSSVTTSWMHNASLNAGICYFLFPGFTLELNYNAVDYFYRKHSQNVTASFNPGNIRYGFRYYFIKK